MKLSEILTEARKGTFIFKVAVKDASKVVSQSKGELMFANTLFQKKYFKKNNGDEIISSLNGNKETNITELENCIKRHSNYELIIRIGNINYEGVVQID